MQMCERSGANAIAIHLRRVDEDRKDKMNAAHWDEISQLCSAVQIPVIANGDFLSRDCIADFWRQERERHDGDEAVPSGPAAVMVARGALWNPGIFSRELVSYDDVVRNYINTAAR